MNIHKIAEKSLFGLVRVKAENTEENHYMFVISKTPYSSRVFVEIDKSEVRAFSDSIGTVSFKYSTRWGLKRLLKKVKKYVY